MPAPSVTWVEERVSRAGAGIIPGVMPSSCQFLQVAWRGLSQGDELLSCHSGAGGGGAGLPLREHSPLAAIAERQAPAGPAPALGRPNPVHILNQFHVSKLWGGTVFTCNSFFSSLIFFFFLCLS